MKHCHNEPFYPLMNQDGQPCKPDCPPSSIVPPPIPPVQYVPGMNVQEQLCNMAEHVNTAINRWNQIQANCYQALDQCVGAAVNNDVYYAPDEVKFMEGYDQESSCPYQIIEAKAVDRAGRPIFCHLRPAYNNITNSGAQEKITDVSFITSAQAAITAVQSTETHWKGTSVFNGNPGNAAPDDTVWVCGWTRNGVLRFFRGDVSLDLLRQNRMVNCIGPVFPVVSAGKLFTEVTGSIGENPGSIQAIGWKQNGNKVFFSCGCYDVPGMTPQAVANILLAMGCFNAVITSYQTQAATAWDATPIAGTESAITYATDDVISAPGLTGGMTFLGKLSNAPIQWNIPANCANWVISKMPKDGWRNAFTTEVANIVQKLGNTENSMNSILGQLNGENQAISNLQHDVQQNADNIAELQQSVGTFDGRIKTLETGLDQAEQNIATLQQDVATLTKAIQDETVARETADNQLQQAIDNERNEREAADTALQGKITQEQAARESADTVLQNKIDTEASTRATADSKLEADIDSEAKTRGEADRNLQAAIEAEQSARSTKDTQHEARMDQLEAQEQKDFQQAETAIDELQQTVENLQDGSGLPVATTEKLGAVIIGDGLNVDETGKISVKGGATGGDVVSAGEGIEINENDQGEKVISVDDTIATTAQLTPLEQSIDGQSVKIDALETGLSGVKTDVQDLQDGQTAQAAEIADVKQNTDTLTENVNTLKDDVEKIQDGSGLPIASADTLGGIKIGANLSISEDGTLSATGGEGGTGETVAQGDGITVEHNTTTNVATVSLNAETKETLAKVQTIETEQGTIKTAVDGLETNVETLSGNVQTLTTAQEDADKAIKALQTAGGESETEIAGVKDDVTAIQQKDTEQDTKLGTLETMLSDQSKDIEDINQNIQVITTKNTEQDTAIETAQSTADEAKTQANTALAAAQSATATAVQKTGDTMTGNLQLQNSGLLLVNEQGVVLGRLATLDGNVGIIGADGTTLSTLRVATPSDTADAANKGYVDSTIEPVSEAANNANVAATEAASQAAKAKTQASEAKTAADAASAAVDSKVSKSGDTITGTLTVQNGNLNVTTDTYKVAKLQGSGQLSLERNMHAKYLNLSAILTHGSLPSAILFTPYDDTLPEAYKTSGGVILNGINNPVNEQDAANKRYVDNAIGNNNVSIVNDTMGYSTITFSTDFRPNLILVLFKTINNNLAIGYTVLSRSKTTNSLHYSDSNSGNVQKVNIFSSWTNSSVGVRFSVPNFSGTFDAIIL